MNSDITLKKLVVFLAGFILIALFIFFILGFLQSTPNPSGGSTQPTISVTPDVKKAMEEYKKNAANTHLTEAPQLKKDAAVGSLYAKLPHTGNYFSFYFNYTTGQFVLILNKAHAQEGTDNFKAFLKDNGVEDVSWIKNLTVDYK